MSFWWSWPVERFGRALNLLVNFCPSSDPRTLLATFSALDSHFHILHSAASKQQTLQNSLLSPVPHQCSRAAMLQGGVGRMPQYTPTSALHGRRSRSEEKLTVIGAYFYPVHPHPQHKLISEYFLFSSISIKCSNFFLSVSLFFFN